MSLYGKSDAASNVSVVVVSNVQKTPNTDNRTALFGNTTADAFVTGATVGVFGADAGEVQASRAGANTKVVAPGWILRTEGSGGRAGRVTNETLAVVRMSSDAEDTVLADYKLRIVTQPSAASANATANETAAFTVVGGSTPAGATLSYVWQKYNGSAFANLSNAGAYSNTTTATLSVLANTASNGEIYRVRVASTGGANAVFSSNAVITITT